MLPGSSPPALGSSITITRSVISAGLLESTLRARLIKPDLTGFAAGMSVTRPEVDHGAVRRAAKLSVGKGN